MFEITKLEVRKRTRNRAQGGGVMNAKTRVYVFTEGESILEDFGNRTSRPSKLYRKHVMPLVVDKLFPNRKATFKKSDKPKFYWNKYAGCSMCPCSPGFVMETHYGHDVFVTVTGAAKRTDPDAALQRLEQLIGTDKAKEVLKV